MQKNPKILLLCGSTKSKSINSKLLDSILGELSGHECEITRINLSDYTLPLYNGDYEADKGAPDNATKLAKLFDTHQAVVIVSPEYNGSLTPLLKNTVDWISRVKTVNSKKISPFAGKVTAIASCSPGKMGGISMLYHLRDILTRLGMLVISEQLAVGNAANAFDEMDRLLNERSASIQKQLCLSLIEKAVALNK